MDNKYYVYQHIDPKAGEVVYIGKGCNARAWRMNGRGTEHKDLLKSYIPDEFVQILHRGCTNSEALEIEGNLIKKYNPKFNTAGTEDSFIISDINAKSIYDLYHNHKRSIADLSRIYEVSKSPIRALLLGKTHTHLNLPKRPTEKGGERNNTSKLKEIQVREIFSKYEKGTYTYESLAKLFKVSKYCIYGILKGKTWKHLRLVS